MNDSPPPKLLLVGGPDVDARIELMQSLGSRFKLAAVGSNKKLYTFFQHAGFEYYYYPLARNFNPLSDLISFFVLVKIFLVVKPVIVHCFDTKPLVIARLAAKFSGVPIVIGTVTGLGTLYENSKLVYRLMRYILSQLQKIACRISELTIFYNRGHLQQFVQEGIVSKQKTALITGSGVVTDKFDPAKFSKLKRDAIRAKFNISSETILVTMISRIVRSKGVLEFSSMASEMKFLAPEIGFLLVGPHDKESIDSLSDEELLRLKQTVVWPGPDRDIPSILAASDIFLFLSYHEGIPRVLLEAASMELPIVTTNLPGCHEVVSNNINGFLVPVGDVNAAVKATLQLIQNPDLRNTFGKAARQLVRARFDISIVSQQMILLYENLLANKGHGLHNG